MKLRTRRPPRRIFRSTSKACGRATVWCGPGSQWDNPWRARSGERLVQHAILRAHAAFNNPRWIHAGSILHGPRPPDKRERAYAMTRLYNVWVDRRVCEVPASVGFAMSAAMTGGDGASPFPEPPSIEEIRAALRGRNLADAESLRMASHVNVLLAIANAEEP